MNVDHIQHSESVGARRPYIVLTFIRQQLEPLLSHAEKACEGMPKVQKKGSLEDLHASGADRRLLFISASLSIRCCHLWRRRRTLERISYRALMCGLKWPEQNCSKTSQPHKPLHHKTLMWCAYDHFKLINLTRCIEIHLDQYKG